MKQTSKWRSITMIVALILSVGFMAAWSTGDPILPPDSVDESVLLKDPILPPDSVSETTTDTGGISIQCLERTSHPGDGSVLLGGGLLC